MVVSSCCRACVCINTSIRTSLFDWIENIYLIASLSLSLSLSLSSREREREKSRCIGSRQRNKHQTESLAGKHQYFPRTARTTNTHSIGYRWRTMRATGDACICAYYMTSEKDAMRVARTSKRARRSEEEPRKREVSEVRGAFQFELHEVALHATPSFTRGTDLCAPSRSYEAKRCANRAYPYSFRDQRIHGIFDYNCQCLMQNGCTL